MNLATDKFMALYAEVSELLERLNAAHENHYNADPHDTTWASVNELGYIKNNLSEIVDFATKEREYVPMQLVQKAH